MPNMHHLAAHTVAIQIDLVSDIHSEPFGPVADNQKRAETNSRSIQTGPTREVVSDSFTFYNQDNFL